MTPSQLRELGQKLRTQVRGPLFDYIEGTLPFLSEPVIVASTKKKKPEPDGCSVCAERRASKAASMKRYRDKQK